MRNFLIAKRSRLGFLIYSLLGLSLLTISIIYFFVGISRPYIGMVVAPVLDKWTVQNVDPNGLAAQAGIQIGDIPTQINGQSANVFLEKYIKNGAVFGTVIREITVEDNSGVVKSASLTDTTHSWQYHVEQISWPAVCIIFWIIGLYVVLKRPEKIAAQLLFVTSLVFGLTMSANLASETTILFAPEISVIAAVIGPWLLVHFFLVLPDERVNTRQNPLIYLIYVIPGLTLILMPTLGWSGGQPMNWFRTLRLFEYGAGFLTAIGLVFFNYLHAGSVKTRHQMRIVLISCVAALLPFVILNLIPEAIWGHGQGIISPGFSLLFIGFIPLGMGYAVVTQKLLDIDVVIRRTIVYGLLTIILAAILSVSIVFTSSFKENLSVPQNLAVALGLGIIAAVLFGPLKNRIETVIDRLFYKDRYEYRQIIHSLSASLNSLKNFNDESRLIVGTIVQAMNLSGACLLIKSQSDSFEISAAQGSFTDSIKQSEFLSVISKRNKLVEFPNSALAFSSNLAFLIPLVAGEKEIGILCLSPKVTRQDFSTNDFYLLQGIASVSAIALRAALLTRDVSVRDTFISIASHELRTPLTSIMGFADLLLRRDPQVSTRKEWAKHILDNSKRLSNMVDDLLNVSRIQSGKINLKIERINFVEVLNEQLSLAKESTDNHSFIINIDSNLPAINVDRDKFGQVIANLLNNAIKYSPKGGRITISAANYPKQNKVQIGISDEGIGIGAEDKISLFTTFHRIQRSETEGIKGSGLGLYIAKEWTEKMGGEIWVESELNKGSTFFLSFQSEDIEMPDDLKSRPVDIQNEATKQNKTKKENSIITK